MRVRSDETKQKIHDFVNEYYNANHKTPSTSVIANELGVNKSTAWRYLNAMQEDGTLLYDGDEIQTKSIGLKQNGQVSVPLTGSIPCGTPQEQEACVECYFSFPREVFGQGEFFMLRADGDSMIDAGINDRDLVVIKKDLNPREGQIVAALIGNESTLKTLLYDRDGRPYLHAENKMKNYPDRKPDEFSVQGIAVHVMKAL